MTTSSLVRGRILVDEERSVERQMEIERLLSKISSSDTKEARSSLKKLHQCLLKGSFKRKCVEKGGIHRLSSRLVATIEKGQNGRHQPLTSVISSTEVNNKEDQQTDDATLVLSCLKKLMTGNRTCIEQFVKVNGLQSLGRLLPQTSNERALKYACSLITEVAETNPVTPDVISALVNILPQYQNTQNAVTILRTLWTTCSSLPLICAASLATEFPSVVKALSSENENVAKAALKVLHKFLRCTDGNEPIVGLRILESDGLPLLLAVMQKDWKESDNCMVSYSLYRMIGIPQVRVSNSCTDVIHFCATELSQDCNSKRFKNSLLSLCLCAMEAINRNKLRCTGALEKLVKLLGDPVYAQHHFQIVSTFVCFLFDEPSLDVMLRAGLLSNLLSYLEWLLKLQSDNQLDSVPKTVLSQSKACMSPDVAQGPASADGSSPNIHGARGHFHDVMLLLGKLSQTSAIRFMVTKSCIHPILTYLSTASYFDLKAVKILGRITENPQFFELLLKRGLIQSMYLQLKTGFSMDALEAVVRQELTSDLGNNIMLRCNTDIVSFFELSKSCNRSSSTSREVSESEQQTADDDSVLEKFSIPLSERNSSHQRKRCAKTLIRNLSRHAESPFGQGVLKHAVLSDSHEKKEAFVLGYCFMCRSAQFEKHIFIDLHGLSLVINLILASSENERKLCNGFMALYGLAKSSGINLKKRSFKPPLDVDSCSESTYTQTSNRKRRKFSQNTDSNSKIGYCLFETLICSRELFENRFYPDDSTKGFQERDELIENSRSEVTGEQVCFYLEDCTRIVINRDAVQSASPVFAAMLSDSFVDSSLPFVSLQGVNSASFLLLLHHVLGCSVDLGCFQCVNGCKFNGTVEVTNGRRVYSTRENGDGNVIVNNSAGKNMIESPELKHTRVVERAADRKWRVVDVQSCHENQECVNDSRVSCLKDVISDQQRICLLTDVLRISDRFLVDNLRTKCEQCLQNSISEETVLLLYMEGLLSQARLLSDSCVTYLLFEVEDPATYLKIAVTIFKSLERVRFMSDLRSVLESQIDNSKRR